MMMLDATRAIAPDRAPSAGRASTDGDAWVAPRVLDLRDLWHGLFAGRFFLASSDYVGDRALVTLEPPPASPTFGIGPRDPSILARVLRGERRQPLADELGLSLSRIATRCANTLAMIGNERVGPHTSIVLVMAAHAAAGVVLEEARVESAAVERWVISVDNPARALSRQLSPSEYAVARLAVEGKPSAEIARLRSTSPRTIANQLGSTFRKLGVSGCCELRARAVRDHARSLGAPPVKEPTA